MLEAVLELVSQNSHGMHTIVVQKTAFIILEQLVNRGDRRLMLCKVDFQQLDEAVQSPGSHATGSLLVDPRALGIIDSNGMLQVVSVVEGQLGLDVDVVHQQAGQRDAGHFIVSAIAVGSLHLDDVEVGVIANCIHEVDGPLHLRQLVKDRVAVVVGVVVEFAAHGTGEHLVNFVNHLQSCSSHSAEFVGNLVRLRGAEVGECRLVGKLLRPEAGLSLVNASQGYEETRNAGFVKSFTYDHQEGVYVFNEVVHIGEECALLEKLDQLSG